MAQRPSTSAGPKAAPRFDCDECGGNFPLNSARTHFSLKCSALPKGLCSFCGDELTPSNIHDHVTTLYSTEMGLSKQSADPDMKSVPILQFTPQEILKKAEQLGAPNHDRLRNKGAFLLLFDPNKKCATYSFESLTAEMMEKGRRVIDRHSAVDLNFNVDPAFPANSQISPTRVKCNDFHLGHIAPAANYRYSETDYRSTFDLSNTYAMLPNVNLGVWSKLESHVRKLTNNWDRVNVFSGLVLDEPATRHLKLPFAKSFFKIIHLEREGSTDQSQVFLIPHEPGLKRYWDCRSTLGEIADLTGLTFLWKVNAPLTWNTELGRSWKCHICGLSFTTKAILGRHKGDHKELHQCGRDGCDRKYPYPKTLLRHIAIHHEKKELFPCTEPDCTKVYLYKRDRDVHMDKHHAKEKILIPCDQCDKTFDHPTNLANHVRWVHGEKKLICGIDGCKYSTTHRGNLNKHRKTHLPNTKEFKCSMCPSAYSLEASLKTHIKQKHSGKEEKPIVCQKLGCGTHFTTQGNLNRHLRETHSASADDKVQEVVTSFFVRQGKRKREEKEETAGGAEPEVDLTGGEQEEANEKTEEDEEIELIELE